MYVRLHAEKENKMTNILYWVWLTSTMKFASAAINRVLFKFTPEAAYEADEDELTEAGLEKRTVEKLMNKSLTRAEKIIEKCKKKNISILCSSSPDYPRALDRLDDKPHVIYVRGDISCIKGRKTVSFIGTRKMTRKGEAFGTEYARRLISEGNLLISGIADGIDTLAAAVSIEMGVPTVAVLGVDIDRYYPRINERLIDKVADIGAVISEYPPDTDARFFATRNRIIVGLSDTVNVIEAPLDSGALIGAELALRKGIPTFACDLDGDTFEGCRMLISKGATPINDGGKRSATILAEKMMKTAASGENKVKMKAETEKAVSSVGSKVPDDLQGTCRHIYEKLMDGPKNEDVFITPEHSVSRVLCALTELELKGYIKVLPGSKYQLK